MTAVDTMLRYLSILYTITKGSFTFAIINLYYDFYDYSLSLADKMKLFAPKKQFGAATARVLTQAPVTKKKSRRGQSRFQTQVNINNILQQIKYLDVFYGQVFLDLSSICCKYG